MNDAIRFAATSAVKDLRRLWRDPLGLVLSIAMPLAITVLISVVFGRSAPAPRGKLLVVDHDDTTLSALVRGAFGQGPLSRMVVVETVGEEEGRTRIGRGDGSGLLTIPQGFQSAVLRDEPCQLKLLTNPAERILPNIIAESLTLMAEAEFYGQALLGEQIRKFVNRPPTEAEIAETSVAIRRLISKFERYLDPVVIELDTKVIDETANRPSIGVLFFPGMLFFGALMVGQSLAGDVWKEKSAGTLRRTLTTPARLGGFVLGKVLAAAAVLAGLAVFGCLCARILLDVSIASPWFALLWLVGSGAVMYVVLMLVNLVAGSERGASVLTSLAVFALGFAGGGLFPFEMMPEWMVRIGRWTPNGWAATQFKEIIGGTATPRHLATAAGALAVIGGVAFLLSLRRLRRFPLA